MYLAVILPPNNSETGLLKLKRRIFQETGAVSAWALKPMIPFAFMEQKPAIISRRDLPQLPPEGLAIDRIIEKSGQVCLGSEVCAGFCKELISLFKEYGLSEGFDGLHLFDSSDCGYLLLSKDVAEMEETVLHWHSCTLSVYRTETKLFRNAEWWERVVLEDIFEIKFPGVPKT